MLDKYLLVEKQVMRSVKVHVVTLQVHPVFARLSSVLKF